MNENVWGSLKKERRDKHPFWIWESIMQTPVLLKECMEGLTYEQIVNIKDKCIKKGISNIFLVGVGSSYDASIAESFAFEEYTKLPSLSRLTSEFREYQEFDLDEHSAVFFHSHSGKTKGDVETVEKAKGRGAYTIAVTDHIDSPLSLSTEDVLIGPGGSKAELPSSRTYSTAMFRMMLLAIELGMEISKSSKLENDEKILRRTPKILGDVTNFYINKAADIVEKIKDCQSFVILSFGPNYATADEAALGLSQSSGVPVQPWILDHYLHGPIQTLNSKMGVILIASPGPLQDRMLQTAKACGLIGAKVILLSPDDLKCEVDCDVYINLPAGIPETITPVIYITPLLQIAYHFSLLGRGCHPDRLSMDKPEFVKAFSNTSLF